LGLILGVLWVSYTNLELLVLILIAPLSIVFNSENHLAVAKIEKKFQLWEFKLRRDFSWHNQISNPSTWLGKD
jgi:hypothetical protein